MCYIFWSCSFIIIPSQLIVKVDEVEGEVKDIGLRASQIRCWDGSDVLVPNDYLISGKLTNRTFDDKRRRLEIELQLDIDIDAKQVMNLAIEAAKTIPELMKKPGPYANYVGIIDGKSIVKIYGWVNDYSIGVKVGIDFKIAPLVAIKSDYQWFNDAVDGTNPDNMFNAGIGIMF